MRILLFLSAVIALIAGVAMLFSARSAIHEIEGFVLILISAVCMAGAGTVEAVNRLRDELKASSRKVE